MDPDVNLAAQLTIAERVTRHIDAGQTPLTSDVLALAERVIALDEWIRKGGFLPEPWACKKSHCEDHRSET